MTFKRLIFLGASPKKIAFKLGTMSTQKQTIPFLSGVVFEPLYALCRGRRWRADPAQAY
jgi:hypothetical protein